MSPPDPQEMVPSVVFLRPFSSSVRLRISPSTRRVVRMIVSKPSRGPASMRGTGVILQLTAHTLGVENPVLLSRLYGSPRVHGSLNLVKATINIEPATVCASYVVIQRPKWVSRLRMTALRSSSPGCHVLHYTAEH